MIPGINTSRKEEAEIRYAFDSWAGHFQRAFNERGLAFLLESYENLIRSLETGRCEHSSNCASCCGDFYEFMNDLAVRNAIEIILDVVTEGERTRIAALVESLDERYRRTQIGADFFLGSAARSRYSQAKYWWYYGLPRSVHR